jgi:uncharacterized protein (DUF2147 family)
MKRLACLVGLVVLSSSAYADNSYSLVVAGHRILIGAPYSCGSPSCVSVSLLGIRETPPRRRERLRVVHRSAPAEPAKAEHAPQQPVAASPPPDQPAAQSQAAVEPQAGVPPPLPLAEAPPPQVSTHAAAPPANEVVAAAAPATAPAVKDLREAEEAPADSPLGDWRPQGGEEIVRIEPCGKALCGRVLDRKSNSLGESVLVNMRPKTADTWSGDIYSRASGTTYYGTLSMRSTNSLRVEACATNWSRVARPQEMLTSIRKASVPGS